LGHPDITNGTPFAFTPLFLADEDLRPVVVTVVKATFRFDLDGNVWLADEQVPVSLTGQPSTDAAISSYRYEPEIALCKLATDVVLLGHARPPTVGATQIDAGIRVGPVQKLARVFGDRFWVRTDSGVRVSRTAALELIPLIWENAFGGQDTVHSTPERPRFEARNPVGTGYGTPLTSEGDHLRLPNIEDPTQLIAEYGAIVPPCGFGFTSPNWEPRAALAGTYDERWSETRKPLLPIDFDRRFFSAAAPGLVAPGYLRGDEDVILLNVTPRPRLDFRLPCVLPPVCRVVVRGQPDTLLATNLDTVIVNTDDELLTLVWRAHALIGNGPHDVVAIKVEMD
jgi:hypothetical protein